MAQFSQRVQIDSIVYNELGDPDALLMTKDGRPPKNAALRSYEKRVAAAAGAGAGAGAGASRARTAAAASLLGDQVVMGKQKKRPTKTTFGNFSGW